MVDNMEIYEKIVKANNEIKTISLKGKKYAEVKERIIAFRKVYPRGKIHSDVKFSENYVIATATICDGSGYELGIAHARELLNRPFALENAETSAIGRAIGIATGMGISTSLSSFEDMKDVDNPSGIFDEDKDYRKKLEATFKQLDLKKQADLLNFLNVKSVEEVKTDILSEYLKRNEKQKH